MENINLHEAEKITELPYETNSVFIQKKRKWPKILLSIVAGMIILCTLLYLIFPGAPYYFMSLQLDEGIYNTLQNYSHYDKTLTGETQKIECNGLTVTLPYDMTEIKNADSDTSKKTYQKSGDVVISLPDEGEYLNADVFSYMDEKIPQEKIDNYKEEISKSMGEFPETQYKHTKMLYQTTIKDMKITNKYQSAFCYTLLINKCFSLPTFEYYLFEKDNICGFLVFDRNTDPQKSNHFVFSFYNKADENTSYSLIISAKDESFTDTAYAIINSIQFNK